MAEATATLSPYFAAIRRHNILTREEEAELAMEYRETGSPEAAERLVMSNLRFVVRVAGRYRKYGLPWADLLQEGNMGLLHAVRKFDPSRETRLVSYAAWWIKAYIHAYIVRSWSMVRIGTTQAQRRLFYALPATMARRSLDAARLTDADVAALAEELRAAPREVRSMLVRLGARDQSLDAPADPESGTLRVSHVVDSAPGPEALVGTVEEQAVKLMLLEEAMACLSPRERKIIERRHRGAERPTLREVGAELGLSRERVRQLESQALSKLSSVVQHRFSSPPARRNARRVA